MGRRRPCRVVSLAGSAAGVAACSSSGSGSTGQNGKTPAARFAAVLGHHATGLAATVAQRGTLLVGEDPEFAPQSSLDDAGTWSGFDIDVARKLGAALGLKVKFVKLDWARVPAALAADRYDVAVSSIATDPRPSGKLAFAAPYTWSVAEVAVRQDGAALTTLGQLKGKTIGVGAATSFQRFLEAAGGVSVALYASDADVLPDVANGTIAGAMTATTTAASERASGEQITATGPGFFYQPQAFAVRPNEADLVAVLNSAVKTMHADGTLSTLSKKWYHGLDVSKPPAAGVPTFTKALALLKAGTYPLD